MNPKKILLHWYFKVRNTKPVWRFLNREAIRAQSKHAPTLNAEQERIVAEMKKTGIATSTLDTLFPEQNLLETLQTYAQSLNPEEAKQGRKLFLKRYWDTFPVFNTNNPFVKLALDKRVLDIANAYMGMWTKLKYFDLSMTLPVTPGSDAVQSQRWHRDPQEKKIFKMFIYLNDVGDDGGPFFHVLESNHDGKYGHLFPQETPLGVYITEEDLYAKIPRENVKKMTAPAGTVIFCDTSGIHKGGYATKNERLMSTSFFTAPSYKEKASYSFDPSFDPKNTSLCEEAVFSISK